MYYNTLRFIYENVGQHAEKPTAHSGTFGFADTQSQRKKPKEPKFLPTLNKDEQLN